MRRFRNIKVPHRRRSLERACESRCGTSDEWSRNRKDFCSEKENERDHRPTDVLLHDKFTHSKRLKKRPSSRAGEVHNRRRRFCFAKSAVSFSADGMVWRHLGLEKSKKKDLEMWKNKRHEEVERGVTANRAAEDNSVVESLC